METAKKANPIYFFGIVLVMVTIIAYTFTDTGVKENYEEQVLKFRTENERFFREQQGSPIEDKTSFRGLDYFEPSAEYRILAVLERITTGDSVMMQMSDGKKETYGKYAHATFQLGGKSHRLLLLKHAEDEKLFLPFADQTNGFDTYGGGRYLDLTPERDLDKLMIDFNFAYNPYCAYNKNYSCPLPPRGNFLNVEIRAGEKDYSRPEKK
ncbi:MAG: DUF1684 domain-containing protein [Ferruginibacter sp.]|nr:DUF1684 domain-containing protein [Cytophagales bacterium]